ncbi:efflux RND transporter periplasmic adaptor subunit [bacterium]|nr:efflux RND transporter periplasmic adaptor subunit [bacterium]
MINRSTQKFHIPFRLLKGPHMLRTPSHLNSFASIALCTALSSIFLGCTGHGKVDLPKDTPEVQAGANLATSSLAVASEKQNAGEPSAGAVVASANGSTAASSGKSASTNTPVVAASAELVTRVSGQVNSGKQGQASFKVAGHISKTLVQVGEKVRQGQVLAALDDVDAQLRLKLSQNQKEQAKIALEQARKDMQREEQLKKEGATTQSNLERMTNALANAQIAFAQAQIALQQAEKSAADTKLTAAFDGVVSRRLKVEGEYVAVGAPVFEVASMSELEVSLRVPENLIKKVKPGEKVTLSIPSLGKDTQAKILRIVPVIQENSRTFEVIGRVQGALPGEIIPGQFVEAQL